jgi:hypothetical protein
VENFTELRKIFSGFYLAWKISGYEKYRSFDDAADTRHWHPGRKTGKTKGKVIRDEGGG